MESCIDAYASVTFLEFWNGQPLHYMGYDDVKYIAKVSKTCGIRQTIIKRADNGPIEIQGLSLRRAYNLPIGRITALNTYDMAIRHPVKQVQS